MSRYLSYTKCDCTIPDSIINEYINPRILYILFLPISVWLESQSLDLTPRALLHQSLIPIQTVAVFKPQIRQISER